MSLFKKIFKRAEEPISNAQAFWQWFQSQEKKFFEIIKRRSAIEESFINVVSAKLQSLDPDFYLVVGMANDTTAELVITAEGDIKKFALIEQLIEAAPKLENWKFTALKPSLGIEDFAINMAGFIFDQERISFVANDVEDYPDEIDLTFVHTDLDQQNVSVITQGVFIYLDNVLGELGFADRIDDFSVQSKAEVSQELIPLSKLFDYLSWREKEFVEKYEGIRYSTEEDNFALYEAQLEDGLPLVAMINADLLHWDKKPSHPWFLTLKFEFDGTPNRGMPNIQTSDLMKRIEDEISAELKDIDGYLNLGRQTCQGEREVYFACKEFRKPSLVLAAKSEEYQAELSIKFEIYKDKYWRTLNRFQG